MSCTIAYKLCTAFSVLTFKSVVDFKNLLKDIYNSLFLIQVKHGLWNYLFLYLLEKWRVNRVPCLVWHYCASHNVCCDCEICSISEIIKTCTVFKSTFMKYLILTTVKNLKKKSFCPCIIDQVLWNLRKCHLRTPMHPIGMLDAL